MKRSAPFTRQDGCRLQPRRLGVLGVALLMALGLSGCDRRGEAPPAPPPTTR